MASTNAPRLASRAGGLIAGVLLGSTVALPVLAADMTFDRALNVQNEPQNWLLHHQNYAAHRYSPLTQINGSNVANMKMVFGVGLGGLQAGGKYAFGDLEATPIVEDGMMYVTDGWGSVYKIDVTNGKKGQILWKYDPGTDRAWAGDVACCGVDNRGVALWKNLVISPVLDGRLLAINKDSGELVWERQIADPAIGETITAAPLVIRDLAITGMAGGELGVRGHIDGTDLNTGKEAWRTYTIPAKGEPGNETWMDDHDAWMHGGGTTWVTGTYDRDLDVMYWGTGNAGPDYDPEYRPGDNKWAASVLAFDAQSGKIKWGFQYTPNDPYDYDEISEHPLVDVVLNGEPRKMVIHAARNGHFYALDRTNGQFLHAKAYTDNNNWSGGIDPKTGKPMTYNAATPVQIYAPGTHGLRAAPIGNVCTAIIGGKNWQPAAYNPVKRLLYVGGHEGCTQIETKKQDNFVAQGGTVTPRQNFTGGGTTWKTKPTGSLKAIDVLTGDVKAKLALPYPDYSGTLATAGGLVFTAHYDGRVTAHDDSTLNELWSFSIGSGINAPPMSYSVNGKQYIAVLVGSRQSPTVIGQNPELKNTAPASMLLVFSL